MRITFSLSLLLLAAILLIPENFANASHSVQIKTERIAYPIQNKALDFTLVNQTGYQISGIYLSPSNEDDWGENILTEILGDGEAVDI